MNQKRDCMLSGAIPYCHVFKVRKDRIKKAGGGMRLYPEKGHFIIYYRKEGRHLHADTGELVDLGRKYEVGSLCS